MPAPTDTGSGGIASGLAVAAIGGVLAILLHAALPLVSALLIAIVLGVVFATIVGPRTSFTPGLAVASRGVLRIGVALLGFQLVVGQVLGLGWPVLVIVVLIVVGGIAAIVAIGSILGVPTERRLLIACGFSICGAAAVAAADGVTDSDEEDVAIALALVVAFGSVLPVPGWLRLGVAEVQGFALATAMFALGCGIDIRSMRRLRSTELLLGVLSSVSRPPVPGGTPRGRARRSRPRRW